MIRLQGRKFQEMRPYLKLIGYDVSNNNNIRAIMKHKYNNRKYTHWLNEEEKERFLQSDFYKNNKPIDYSSGGSNEIKQNH